LSKNDQSATKQATTGHQKHTHWIA
jgi:hypothetical protein